MADALLIRMSPRCAEKAGHPLNRQPHLGLFYAQALLRAAGGRADVLDSEVAAVTQESAVAAWRALDRAAVFISTGVPLLRRETSALAAALKAAGAPRVVLVDVPEAAAGAFLSEGGAVDGMIVGEFEHAVVEAARGRALEDVAGMRTRAGAAPPRAAIQDLDALPRPDHAAIVRGGYDMLYPMQAGGRRRWGHVMASRGCPHACTFCAVRVSYGRAWRERGTASLLDELEFLRAAGATVVNFVDDVFITRPERVAELCEGMIARGLDVPWLCQTRAEGLTPELARLMRRAGCSTACVGVEAGSDRLLAAMRKGTTVAGLERAFETLHGAGIWPVAYLIVGHPEETEADRRALADFVARVRPRMFQVSTFTPYPSSPAFAGLDAPGRARALDAFHYADERADLRRFRAGLYRRHLARPEILLSYGLERLSQAVYAPGRELRTAWGALRYLVS